MKPAPDDYPGRLPEAEDVLLPIEVCDTTMRYDQAVKAPLYARFGIPESFSIPS